MSDQANQDVLAEGADPGDGGDDLAQFGYRQELDRTLGKFSSFAAGFSYLSILTGVVSLFGLGFGFAGPGFWWMWPVVFGGQLLVALLFAEMAGQFPLSGSVYQWAKQVAHPWIAWLGGWMVLVGSVITLAAVAVGYQVVLPVLWNGFEIIGTDSDVGTYSTPDGAKNAIVLAIFLVLFTTIVNTISVKVVAFLNNAGVAVELGGAVLLVLVLAWNIKRSPGIILDTHGLAAGHAWGYLGALLLAALMPAYIFYGYDTAGSLAEETRNPRRNAPPGIYRAVIASAGLGGLLMLFGMMAVPNIEDPGVYACIANDATHCATGTSLGLGLPYIFNATLGTTLAKLFLVASIFAVTVCSLAVHAGCVRMIFTMSRDGRMPFGSALARVSGRSKTPLIPTVFVGIATMLLLSLNLANQEVFGTLVSIAILFFNIAYSCVTIPLLITRLRGRWPRPTHGPYFCLGRLGLPINIVAVVFQVLLILDLVWPRAEVYGSEWYFRFAGFLVTGLFILVGAAYYFTKLHNKEPEILAEHRA